jgi:hypothetical protein
MILWGMPNLVMICSRMKLATAAPVALRSGMASTHFVKYSVAANIQMYPPNGQPPGMERPWCGHILQIGGVCMDQVGLHLAGVTCFDEVCRIPLHCWPIIAKC